MRTIMFVLGLAMIVYAAFFFPKELSEKQRQAIEQRGVSDRIRFHMSPKGHKQRRFAMFLMGAFSIWFAIDFMR